MIILHHADVALFVTIFSTQSFAADEILATEDY